MTIFNKVLIAATGVVCAFSVACGGGSSPAKTNSIVQTGQNVAPIVVNAGPAASLSGSQAFSYVNGAFASVTVCVPGTSTCQTIDGVLVDTGSFGLRLVSSPVLTIALPQQKAPNGDAVAECLTFLGSYTWGPVQTADVQIAGEKASAVPIQVLSDTAFTVPSGCSSSGFQSADTVENLGANGILGIGNAAQDCPACDPSSGVTNPDLYYACASTTSCTPTTELLSQQVVNPVALFPTDNNGVIVELPSVSGSEATVSGSLVFGIGTQSNNGLGSATVYTIDRNSLSFTTKYNGASYQGSFIDSGSNGYFFLDSGTAGLPNCTDSTGTPTGFYCPTSPQTFSATNEGTNGTIGAVSFSIANADTLFVSSSDTAFSQLGGPSIMGMPSSSNPDFFDWGLPFFYGRNVYVSIEGTTAPGGTTPYWAY